MKHNAFIGLAFFCLALGLSSPPILASPDAGISVLAAQGKHGKTPVLKLNSSIGIAISFLELPGETIDRAWLGDTGELEISFDQPQGQSKIIFLKLKPQNQFKGTSLTILTQTAQGTTQLYSFLLKPGKPKRTLFSLSPAPVQLTATRAETQERPASAAPNPTAIAALPAAPLAAAPPEPETAADKAAAIPTTDDPLHQAHALINGLRTANRNGQITYQSYMHRRVNSLARRLRRGSPLDSAATHSKVPLSVAHQLLKWGGYRPLTPVQPL